MVTEATLNTKGQLTLPKAIREQLNLKTGDRVLFVVRNGRVELEAVHGSILDWYGSIKRQPGVGMIRETPAAYSTAEPESTDLQRVREAVRTAIAAEVVREGTAD
ncbi:MAG: AbrB/MazE/SpoVT family DNA-binding domain-containing protein [Chloroflexaceae bacterium]|jgi:AbrB family looped-hinge helix DNA binding protein|nr:AbrB/MazE/SpoVT family DNA-binding domain-containing protein [Chloroflexaceae bacterium]